MEAKLSIIRVLYIFRMRESGKVNSGSGLSVQLGSNGRQTERSGRYIGRQSRWGIVEMSVLGSQIGGHPR